MKINQLGLIGYPLGHSFSASYFKNKFAEENITSFNYNLFPLENINLFPAFLKNNPDLIGLSVTIPYKQSILKYLDEIDSAAEKIGAVNTLSIYNQNDVPYIKGFNTDYIGFEESIKPLLSQQHTNALILGTGGAAKAVQYSLNRLGINFLSISRTENNEAISYEQLNDVIMMQHKVIINTTPLGMFPQLNTCPLIPYHALTKEHLLFDLVYNPDVSLFLQKGKELGAKVKNGIEMLHLQANLAFEIWKKALV